MTRRSLAIVLVLVFASAVFGGARILNAPPRHAINTIDQQIGQHSYREITENAISKDPRFAALAFAPAPESSTVVPLDQFASVSRAFKLLFLEKERPIEEHSTWVWTPTLEMSDEYMASINSLAKAEGLNTIYLSIDSYLDIFVLPEGEEKRDKDALFRATLRKFISLANENGIEVDAEAGWRNWAEPGHSYKAVAIIDFVKSFNKESPHRFRGFQYDVEPYLLEEYRTSEVGKTKVLKRFMSLVDQTIYHIKDTDLAFSVVIPDFYDKRDQMTPKFEYHGRSDYAFKHLLNVLEKREGSSVIIMSYRNFAKGRDGSIDVTRNEMRTARRGRFSTQIIIAQEVGNVPPPYITFHDTSKSYMLEETEKLRSAFSSHRNFAGLAIHYANAYLELK